MARGDVVTVMSINLADDGVASLQPSSGVEAICTDGGCEDDQTTWQGATGNKLPPMDIGRYDGTNIAIFESGEDGNGSTIWFQGAKHFFDNTNYLYWKNRAGATTDVSISYVVVG